MVRKYFNAIPRFAIPKMPKRRFDVNEELVRRQTFEREEYESFYKAMMKTTAMATYVKRDGKVIPIGSQI